MREPGNHENLYTKTFVEAFGVSEEELRRRGIDPLDYARQRGVLVSPGLGPSELADEASGRNSAPGPFASTPGHSSRSDCSPSRMQFAIMRFCASPRRRSLALSER